MIMRNMASYRVHTRLVATGQFIKHGRNPALVPIYTDIAFYVKLYSETVPFSLAAFVHIIVYTNRVPR